jgi:hypothetical protein
MAQFEFLPTIYQEMVWNTVQTSFGVVPLSTEIPTWYFPN